MSKSKLLSSVEKELSSKGFALIELKEYSEKFKGIIYETKYETKEANSIKMKIEIPKILQIEAVKGYVDRLADTYLMKKWIELNAL